MSTIELELYELLKLKLGEKETKALFTLIESKVEEKKDVLATKEHLVREIGGLVTRLTRTIYTVGLVQYLAMLASLIAIIKFLM